MELKLESATKVCSRCKKDKGFSEFYKQKDRYESLCKKCKKDARFNREKEFATKSSQLDNKFQKFDIPTRLSSEVGSFQSSQFDNFEIESMPELDESIFYPERKMIELGLT